MFSHFKQIKFCPVQTWCSGSALGHGHQCECSILVVPVQKLEHGTRVRALSEGSIQAPYLGTGTCLYKISSMPCFYRRLSLWFEVAMVTRWQDSNKLKRNLWHHGVWTTFHLVPGHRVLARAPSLDGPYGSHSIHWTKLVVWLLISFWKDFRKNYCHLKIIYTCSVVSNESVEVYKLYKIAASSVCFTGYSVQKSLFRVKSR